MSGNFSQQKGKRAEREVVKLLQPVVTKVYESVLRSVGEIPGGGSEVPMLERNLMQSHKGGHDIVGLEWLALEVKHHETLQVEQWWGQAKSQAISAENKLGRPVEPVLIYKQNRTKWKVRMFGYLGAGSKRVRCPVEISVEAFLAWFEVALEHKLTESI